jgi:hypothetical protein
LIGHYFSSRGCGVRRTLSAGHIRERVAGARGGSTFSALRVRMTSKVDLDFDEPAVEDA